MLRSKEDVYNDATLKNLGNNPNGTRMDIIYDAMDIYAKEYHENEVKNDKFLPKEEINIRHQALENLKEFIKNTPKLDIINKLNAIQKQSSSGIKVGEFMGIQDYMDAYAKEYHENEVKNKKLLPLDPFINSVDSYLNGQRNHIIPRDKDRMLTIECVADWCKKFAKCLVYGHY